MHEIVREALDAILAGATPDSQEHQHLDFKEDPERSTRPSGNADAKRIEILIDTAVCFANAEGESFIVLGLRDKACGSEAFTGTTEDPERIRQKIFSATEPNLTVEAEAVEYGGKRLVIIRIPPGLDLYRRHSGMASIRRGTQCVPLSEDERAQLRFRRRNPDLTIRPTELRLDDLDPLALAEGRRLFNMRHPEDPTHTGQDLLRRLGVMTRDGVIRVSGRLLFAPVPPDMQVAIHLWRDAPGSEPSRNDVNAPLVHAIPELLQRIRIHSNSEIDRVDLLNGQERPIRDFPNSAVDEVILNAFAHRDWAVSDPIVVDQSPQSLRVTSPGGLPSGIALNRLLTTTSTPRNHSLMTALHHLGLVEQTSRGFDRMWTAMLESGRQPPEIESTQTQVSVLFLASRVEGRFVQALSLLQDEFGDVMHNVNVLLTLSELTRTSVFTESTAAELFQMSRAETRSTLQWLIDIGLLTHEDGGLFRLTEKVRGVMARAGLSLQGRGDIQSWIIDATRHGSAITNQTIVSATGASPRTVTEILRHLASLGIITKSPEGPSRGPSVQWIARR